MYIWRALSEIKSYNEPPTIIATVIQVVMLMLNICEEEELQEWSKLKMVRFVSRPYVAIKTRSKISFRNMINKLRDNCSNKLGDWSFSWKITIFFKLANKLCQRSVNLVNVPNAITQARITSDTKLFIHTYTVTDSILKPKKTIILL